VLTLDDFRRIMVAKGDLMISRLRRPKDDNEDVRRRGILTLAVKQIE
jgi:hypothetical protein